MKPKTILFATDLSARCDRALDRSVLLAVEWRARLVVVHAMQDPAPSADRRDWRRSPVPRAEAIEEVRRDLQGVEDIDVEVIVERGDPASVVLNRVERTGCDLVVTGVARSETLGRFLLGSTVDELTRHSEVPVLVVKSRPRGPYREIVVATDFSEGSRRALETALRLMPNAQVRLFHAFDVPFEGLLDDKGTTRETAAKNARAEGQAFLAATAGVVSSGLFVPVSCEYGEVGGLLQTFVRAHKAGLVVMGTEGRSRLANVLLGSVAHQILDAVPVDGLVVRRPKP